MISSSNPRPTTTYGTVPTTSAPPITEPVPSNPKRYYRRWSQLLKPSSFSVPDSYSHALFRMQYNLSYFKVNYTFTLLFIMYLSVLYHTPSMSFLWYLALILWFSLYLRIVSQRTFLVFGFLVDERYVLWGLWIVTVVGLVLIGNGVSLLLVLCVGVLVVCLHAGVRDTEYLFLDEESDLGGDGHSAHALVSVVGS